jgi:hypothetical protein
MFENIQPQNEIPVTVQENNGIRVGTAGFILEIFGLALVSGALFQMVCLAFIGYILYIIGIVLSFVGCFTKPRGGLTIAGVVIPSVMFGLVIIISIVMMFNPDQENGLYALLLCIFYIIIIAAISYAVFKKTKGKNISFYRKGEVSTRTFFSIGLLISFFLHWISYRSSYFCGYDIPISEKLKVSDLSAIDYSLYLIPLFAAYNIFNDFTKSKKLRYLNEFVLGAVVSFFISVACLDSNYMFSTFGLYTTAIFSILGLFSRFFPSYKFSALQNRKTGLVQKGMLYQEAGNYSEAFICFYEAAKQNNMIAHNRLGELYEKGLGVKKDINMALKWYEKAVALGDEEAKMRMEILKEEIKNDMSVNSQVQNIQ